MYLRASEGKLPIPRIYCYTTIRIDQPSLHSTMRKVLSDGWNPLDQASLK